MPDNYTGDPREVLNRAFADILSGTQASALADVGGAMTWRFDTGDDDIEPLIVTVGAAATAEPVLTVRVAERVVPELMTGEPSLALAITRNELSITGHLAAAMALVRAWPTIAAGYREHMFEERLTPDYEQHLRSVNGERLEHVDGLPSELQANRPDQMLLVAAILASLPPQQRALQWAYIHHGFELGTIGMENITRLVTSLTDFIAGDSRHEQDRLEYNPAPLFAEDVPAEISEMTFELNPTGGVVPEQLKDKITTHSTGGTL